MGRKANAKKLIRELKEKNKKSKDKSLLKKFRKKSSNKTKSSNKKNKKSQNKSKKSTSSSILNTTRIFGLSLAIVSLVMIVFLAYLLFQKAYRPDPIAKYLPQNRTIGLIEINNSLEHNFNVQAFDLLQNHPNYSKENLISFVETQFQTDYQNDLKPWLGRQSGIALLQGKQDQNLLQVLYFIEILNQKRVIEYFGSPNPIADSGTIEIFALPSGKHFTFIKNYLVLADNKQSIQDIIQDQSAKTHLYRAPEYRRIDDNLPFNRLGFSYINFNKISNGLLSKLAILNQTNFPFNNLEPLFSLFSSQGLIISPDQDSFVIQSFLSLNTEKLKDKKFISHKNKYQAELTAYTPENVLAFWGGVDLEHQINKILEIFTQGDNTQMSFFYKALDSYTKTYFGPNIEFQKDILPLLQNEYALILENQNDINIYKILIKLDNPQEQSQQIETMANDFAKMGSVYEEKIVEHTLEDGTYSQEIIGEPKKIIKKQMEYQDIKINELQIGKRDWGIYYTIQGDLAIISSNLEGVQSSIDLINNNQPSLQDSPHYESNILPLLKHSDELTYLNIEHLAPILFPNKQIPPFIDIIGTVSSGKNYFNDGIVTINYISIR